MNFGRDASPFARYSIEYESALLKVGGLAPSRRFNDANKVPPAAALPSDRRGLLGIFGPGGRY